MRLDRAHSTVSNSHSGVCIRILSDSPVRAHLVKSMCILLIHRQYLITITHVVILLVKIENAYIQEKFLQSILLKLLRSMEFRSLFRRSHHSSRPNIVSHRLEIRTELRRKFFLIRSEKGCVNVGEILRDRVFEQVPLHSRISIGNTPHKMPLHRLEITAGTVHPHNGSANDGSTEEGFTEIRLIALHRLSSII